MNDENSKKLKKTLELLPIEIKNFVNGNVIIIGFRNEYFGMHYGFANTGTIINHIIIFNDNIWEQSKIKISYSVFHEIAHACFDSICSDLECDCTDEKDTNDLSKLEKYSKHQLIRELDALRLAYAWMKPHFKLKEIEKTLEPHIKPIWALLKTKKKEAQEGGK